MFSIRLANGKEASFEHASDLADWYQKEKRAAISSEKAKQKQQQKEKSVENV